MKESVIITIPEEVEDMYWQRNMREMIYIFQRSGIESIPAVKPIHDDHGVKNVDIQQIIEGVKIILNIAIVPIVLAAIKEFAAVKKVKQLKIKTDSKEYVFNAMNAKEIVEILTQIASNETEQCSINANEDNKKQLESSK